MHVYRWIKNLDQLYIIKRTKPKENGLRAGTDKVRQQSGIADKRRLDACTLPTLAICIRTSGESGCPQRERKGGVLLECKKNVYYYFIFILFFYHIIRIKNTIIIIETNCANNLFFGR